MVFNGIYVLGANALDKDGKELHGRTTKERE